MPESNLCQQSMLIGGMLVANYDLKKTLTSAILWLLVLCLIGFQQPDAAADNENNNNKILFISKLTGLLSFTERHWKKSLLLPRKLCYRISYTMLKDTNFNQSDKGK